jgi:hypothetical protein
MSCDDECIVAEGWHGIYGDYQCFIPDHIKIVLGFFGIPPGFDFAERLQYWVRWLTLNLKAVGWYNEQGLVAQVLLQQKLSIISMKEMFLADPYHPLGDTLPDAIHFAGINRIEDHWSWFHYKRLKCINQV